MRKRGIFVSPSGVRSIWQRHGLANFKQLLPGLEKKSAEEGIVLSKAQVQALERKQPDGEVYGESESPHPGYPGSQDTFYVGTIKGAGRIYRRHLWIRTANGPQPDSIPQRPPVTDLFNDRMSPFFASQEMGSILTDRGTEYCSKLETHDYELYLASNGIEHTKIRRVIPRQMASVNASTRPFCKDFISLPSGVYHSLDALQTNLDI